MLNKAHALHRQAEKASRKGRVEEAIQLHKEAADILRDLLQTIINDKVNNPILIWEGGRPIKLLSYESVIFILHIVS